MIENKEQRLAREIYEQVGGMGNVSKIIHCMTRVRMDIKETTLVDMMGLKEIDGVLGIVEEETLQVILGPGIVNKVAKEMVKMGGVGLGETIPVQVSATNSTSNNGVSGREEAERKTAFTKAEQKKKNNTPFKRALKSIANIFVPLIPAFVGAGIIGGIASVLQNLLTAGEISADYWITIVVVLNIIKNGLFGFLNIYVGINAAKVFGATEGLGGVVAGVVYLTGMNLEMPLPNIFTGGDLVAGQGGIIGVVFAVFLLSIVEKALRKVIPDSIDVIVTPTISLLAIGLVTIFLIMPIAGVISSSLVGAITWVLNVGGAFSGFILGLTFLPMVMFGLHQVLTPIHIEMIASQGMTLLLPILAMAGGGQVGAALALWVKCRKNKQLTNMIKGSLPVGILGIGEPLIYAVTLPLGRPFITACVGGGIGGAVIGGIGGIGATAIGPSGVALIPLISGNLWWGYVLGLLAAYIGGFIVTYLFGVSKEAMEATELPSIEK
ncbi:PTS system, sucrose-specific IIC component [Carnobacterium iners]|uniref:PTS system, sucrose-specific IIC component n=1 Tax=Carnobacterium iners TaxID=1073423 RepID=A0A1X7N5A2_9LACT|nr:PTS transporter subunit EIIC [Carnobacterium iners]SEK43883.1 PTS system, sucrose-specific IIC component [Carnobacterium iners]SMH32582.1 PTS system, sucrose-specific IIC component [Carnobacterium iners]